jgi:hypothetical protein
MAETTFKAIPFEKLNPETQSVIEANAKSQGMTPEQYYESRGGVNRSGYYGDAYQAAEKSNRPYMTEEEYAAVIADINAKGVKGTSRGAAINIATAKKAFDAAKARGLSDDAATIESGYNPYTGETATITEVVNPKTGNPEIVFTRGDEYVFADGSTVKINSATVAGNPYYNLGSGSSAASLAATQAASAQAAKDKAERKSAYDLLYSQFAKYGLQSLVAPLEGLIKEGVPASEFAIRLRETDGYKQRFAANQARIKKGLSALSEAEYIGLEDAYQGIMRQYGMPESYYTRGELGRQEGFEKFISGDVSPAELETRISTAYNRVINANPEVVQALKQYYPNITNGDILSYALDPEKALTDINKKVTAAEIGGAAIGAGLGIGMARAEELGAFGVSKTQAQQGYQTIADILPSATKLSEIYSKQGMGPYNQAVAEQEVFGISGAATAAQKRRKLIELETAQFSGTSGAAQGALARERAGQY